LPSRKGFGRYAHFTKPSSPPRTRSFQGQMDEIEHKDKEIATLKRKLGEAEQRDLSVGTSIAIRDSMPVPNEPKRRKCAPKTHKAMEEDE
jgi:hypothetical protein